MMNMGSKLEMNQSLCVDDCLISVNGCFRVTMQGDGNFVVYQATESGDDPIWASGVWSGTGSGPYVAVMQSDGNLAVYQKDHHPIWASGVFPGVGRGPYMAVMQDDGSLVIYEKGHHPIWATNTKWDLTKVELSNITYDLDHVIMKDRPDLLSVINRSLVNDTNVEQEQVFSLEYEHTETDSWSHGLDINAGVKMEIRAGLPCIVNGRVGVGGGGTYRYTSEKRRSTLKNYSTVTSGRVPPHARVICKATLSMVQITLPYSAEAVYHLKNGKRLRGRLNAGYQGTKAYQVQVSWSNSREEVDPLL